jgi:hypothetical protein
MLLPGLVVLAVQATPPSGPAAVVPREAAAFEEQAFAAIEHEDWCRAARLFEQANVLAPTADLLVNAAQAAEYGGDLAGARAFLQRVVVMPGVTRAQIAEAKTKIVALDKKIASSGTGVACPVLAPAPEPAPSSPAPAPAPPSAPPPDDLRPWGFVIGGTGGVITTAGVVVTVVGAGPWFAHAAAVQAIEAAERQRGDAAALQEDQAAARAAWEAWGQTATVAGVVVTSLGVLTAGGGLGWALLGPAEGGE